MSKQQITITPEVAKDINTILATAEKFRNSYFWTPPSSAAGRRAAEFDIEYEFDIAGHHYYVNQYCQNSCRNIYFRTCVEKDGVKTNITPLRTILKNAVVQ